MNEKLFEKIADFIIKEVQENSESSMSGFQYIVGYDKIQEKFNIDIERYMNDKILEYLHKREEVADVVEDTDGFDVVLYTEYAPNYDGNIPDYYIESPDFNDFLELFEEEEFKEENCIVCGNEIRIRKPIEAEGYVCYQCALKSLLNLTNK